MTTVPGPRRRPAGHLPTTPTAPPPPPAADGEDFAHALASANGGASNPSPAGAAASPPAVAPPGPQPVPTSVTLTPPTFPTPTVPTPAVAGIAVSGLAAPGTYAGSYPAGSITSGFTPDGYYVPTSQVPPGFVSEEAFNLSEGDGGSQALTLYTYAGGDQVAVLQNGMQVSAPTTLTADMLTAQFPWLSKETVDLVLDTANLNGQNASVLGLGAAGAQSVSGLETTEQKLAQYQSGALPPGVTAGELAAQLSNAPGTGSPAASGHGIDPGSYSWDTTHDNTWNETVLADEVAGVSASDAASYATEAASVAGTAGARNPAYVAALQAYATTQGAGAGEIAQLAGGIQPGDPAFAVGAAGSGTVPLPPSAFATAIEDAAKPSTDAGPGSAGTSA